MLTGLGYHEVRTVQQSGNAVFAAAGSASSIGPAIEKKLLEQMKTEVKVVIRTHRQLVDAIAADPYADIAGDPAKHLLGFFSAVPPADRIAAFEELVIAKKVDPEVGGRHRIEGDHCYLWCPQGVLKSLFGNVDWDRKLGVGVTMRNWTTVLKLVEMSA